MKFRFYGWYLVGCFCLGLLVAVLLAFHYRKYPSVAALSFVFGIKLGTCLMLLGRCFWKRRNNYEPNPTTFT